MEVIRHRVCCLVIATGIGGLASFIIFKEYTMVHEFYKDLLLVSTIMVTIFLLSLLMWANRKLETARLIIENQIMHIQPAKIDAGSCGETDVTLRIGGIEVFISCFGILLDSKVIKFNLDGIQLRAVEIGRQFICLTYGTSEQTQKIRILHETIGNEELQSIVERFRYETGVVPVISN